MSGLDRLFSGMRSTSLGLSAERVRMDTIAENIANARTTRTPEGGAYRRKMVRFEPIYQRNAQGGITAMGVRAAGIERDYTTPMDKIHDPASPDADANGDVEMPNVSATKEMADLVTSMRAYEANIAAQENFSRLAERALQIAR